MGRIAAFVTAMAVAVSAPAFCGTAGTVMTAPDSTRLRAQEAFSESRFGIFIHWGIYSMLGRGEWVMQNEDIPHEEYSRLAAGFCPSRFDAGEWARLIKASGAGYLTFTTRHHDGFSMFDSKASGYNIVESTPFGRDVLAELAEACAEEGLALHLYYSHLDWGRGDYWPLGRTGHGTGRPEGKEGDWQHYLDFMDSQLTELLTSYGPIGAIWFDGVWDKDGSPREDQPGIWGLEHQYGLIHSLQPACLIGNNHHLLPFPGEDIQIFERDIPGFNEYGLSGQEISALPLETCQTMNRSWGYKIKDDNWKSAGELIEYLVRTAAKGANLLLNVGPRPDGTIPEEAAERLLAIGEWLSVYGESIYGTGAGCVSGEDWGVSTMKDNILYLHMLNPKEEIAIEIPGARLKSARLLKSGEKVEFSSRKGTVTLRPDPEACDPTDTVIKLEFDRKL